MRWFEVLMHARLQNIRLFTQHLQWRPELGLEEAWEEGLAGRKKTKRVQMPCALERQIDVLCDIGKQETNSRLTGGVGAGGGPGLGQNPSFFCAGNLVGHSNSSSTQQKTPFVLESLQHFLPSSHPLVSSQRPSSAGPAPHDSGCGWHWSCPSNTADARLVQQYNLGNKVQVSPSNVQP